MSSIADLVEYKDLIENALEGINEEIRFNRMEGFTMVFKYKNCKLLFTIKSMCPMGVTTVETFQLKIKKGSQMFGPYTFLNYGDLIESVSLFMEINFGKESVIKV